MSAPWLAREAVAQMTKLKLEHPEGLGLDVFTAMGVAAHKQWDDIEFLLGCAEPVTPDAVALLEKIKTRHEVYREAAKGRV